MNRNQLEKNLGRNVKIRLHDGEFIEGRLRKTGEKDFENNPDDYLDLSDSFDYLDMGDEIEDNLMYLTEQSGEI